MKISLTNSKEVYEFLNKEWNSFFNSKKVKRQTKPQYYFFKIEENNKIAGASVLSVKSNIGTIEDILIKKDCREKGIGKELLKSIENKAREENCRKILLKTSNIHTEAKSFYLSNGYKQIAALPNLWYNSDWYFFVK